MPKRTVPVYFSSKQLLLFDFAVQNTPVSWVDLLRTTHVNAEEDNQSGHVGDLYATNKVPLVSSAKTSPGS